MSPLKESIQAPPLTVGLVQVETNISHYWDDRRLEEKTPLIWLICGKKSATWMIAAWKKRHYQNDCWLKKKLHENDCRWEENAPLKEFIYWKGQHQNDHWWEEKSPLIWFICGKRKHDKQQRREIIFRETWSSNIWSIGGSGGSAVDGCHQWRWWLEMIGNLVKRQAHKRVVAGDGKDHAEKKEHEGVEQKLP